MSVALQVVLGILGAATPFILVALAWMRSITSQLTQLHLDVVERSARQDTTLDDHERRLNRLEIHS